jgi:hypothetical protein
MLRRENTRQHGESYATGADFCRIFKENMKDLYLLAFLLTADQTKAEECFVAGLDDCSETNQVFKEWARDWARRVVIKNAIRLIAPVDKAPTTVLHRGGQEQARRHDQADLRAEISTLLGMPAFDRFVLVMSVLEGYKDLECALLLGCAQATFRTARLDALLRFTRSVEAGNNERGNQGVNEAAPIVELVAPGRLATPA